MSNVQRQRAVLITGPTASGKSALALEIAEQRGGVIINADSMQVYDGLRILTARPGDAELAAAPHRLYGHVPPSIPGSAAAWLEDVRCALAESGGKLPVFVGGTGLYFRALLGGLSEMPAIPEAVREAWRLRLAEEGAERLHAALASRDSRAAALLKPADGQRILRALEVLEVSDRSILEWQAKAGEPLIDAENSEKIIVMPDRPKLHQRINARFDAMLAGGAIEETRAFCSLGLDPALPVMKAIGLREIAAALKGDMTFSEAAEKAKAQTRQYAKRQMTWIRNQLGEDWRVIAL